MWGARRREFEEGLRLARAGWQGCIEWRGAVTGSGYGYLWASGKVRHVHILAWEAVNGPIPAGLELDHICRNRLCFNPAHLRLATRSQNAAYAPKRRGGYRSCFKGVEWRSRPPPWRARLRSGGKLIYLGCFPTEEAAARAYDEAAKRFFGEFAWLNFPEGA
jgi:hypothetical protein